jgi:hypothetical protein
MVSGCQEFVDELQEPDDDFDGRDNRDADEQAKCSSWDQCYDHYFCKFRQFLGCEMAIFLKKHFLCINSWILF